MLFNVKVVTPAEYQAYVSDSKTGSPRGAPSDHRRRPAPGATGALRTRHKGSTVVKWITSTDHKVIGHLYLVTSFVFFLFGGLMAMLMRAELARPGNQFVSAASSTTSCSPCTARSCCCCSRRRCSSGSPT